MNKKYISLIIPILVLFIISYSFYVLSSFIPKNIEKNEILESKYDSLINSIHKNIELISDENNIVKPQKSEKAKYIYDMLINDISTCYSSMESSKNKFTKSMKKYKEHHKNCFANYSNYNIDSFDFEDKDLTELKIILTPLFLYYETFDIHKTISYDDILEQKYKEAVLINNVTEFLKNK